MKSNCVLAVLAVAVCLASASGAVADIYNYQTGQVIPGTEGITPGPGINLSNWDTSSHNLRYADFMGMNLQASEFYYSWLDGACFSFVNLTGADFYYATLTGAYLSYANLTAAIFHGATLSGADLTDAVVAGACFSDPGITKGQLYSTASYKAKDLTGIYLGGNDLAGCNLAGQNLTAAYFYDAQLTGADLRNANLTSAYLGSANLTGADLRGAVGASLGGDYPPLLHNTILPDGQIQGLALGSGETLCVRNSMVAITVSDTMTFDADSTLRLELEPDWTSTINLADGVTPQLGGTLDLGLAEGVDPGAMIGDTFYLFNWNGPLPGDNRFSSIVSDLGPNYVWDTSDLYNGGTVALMTYGPQPVPEPGTITLLALGALGLLARRRGMRE